MSFSGKTSVRLVNRGPTIGGAHFNGTPPRVIPHYRRAFLKRNNVNNIMKNVNLKLELKLQSKQ